MREFKKYKSLPYNRALLKKAKQLRQAGLLHEVLLWKRLKSGQLNGLDFDRQKIIGRRYIVDFFCAEKGVVIEVDGITHDNKEKADAKRDAYLKKLGLKVIRIPAREVLQNIEDVMFSLSECSALTDNPQGYEISFD